MSLPLSPVPPAKVFHNWKAHWQTVWPHIKRILHDSSSAQTGTLHQLPTPDLDQITYVSWSTETSPSHQDLVILSHGLEGDARSGYITESAERMLQQGFDVWAWNMRGCGPVMNPGRLLYNSGFTNDLQTLCKHAQEQGYRNIYLMGFSVGGNITCKALGEGLEGIKAAVVFSTPFLLEDVSIHLSKSYGGFYMNRFLKTLKDKIRRKEKQYPGSFALEKLSQCQDFYSFDDAFTAPMHDFQSAHDYYERSSSLHFLRAISIPVYVVSAVNDPFLTLSCFPSPADFPHLKFYYPTSGGHCGFGARYAMADMALDFFRRLSNFDR